MSESGPTQPTWAVQQVGSYLGYTGRGAGVVAKAAFDPQQTCGASFIGINLSACPNQVGDSWWGAGLRVSPVQNSEVSDR
jgi:hypothetical protein